MGPKPSVNITFEGLGDALCYATLLSSVESTGPASAWNGKEEDAQHNENSEGNYSWLDYGYDVWKAFVDYAEQDNFYFLQKVWQVNETKELCWGYYPPDEFKILLYFPETREYAISDVHERYAFDSYFTVNMDVNKSDNGILQVSMDIQKAHSDHLRKEIMPLIARIVLTIVIEMAIALMFGYWEKKQLLLLAGVNTVTQIILNVLLNLGLNSGVGDYILLYFLFEILVVIIEAILLVVFLNKLSMKPKKRWLMVVYAILANVASFYSGIYLADILPELF